MEIFAPSYDDYNEVYQEYSPDWSGVKSEPMYSLWIQADHEERLQQINFEPMTFEEAVQFIITLADSIWDKYRLRVEQDIIVYKHYSFGVNGRSVYIEEIL